MDRLPGPKGFFIDSEEVIAQFRAIQFERKPAEREKLIKNLPTTELRAVAMNVERKGQELMADAKREKILDKAIDAGVERSGRDKQL